MEAGRDRDGVKRREVTRRGRIATAKVSFRRGQIQRGVRKLEGGGARNRLYFPSFVAQSPNAYDNEVRHVALLNVSSTIVEPPRLCAHREAWISAGGRRRCFRRPPSSTYLLPPPPMPASEGARGVYPCAPIDEGGASRAGSRAQGRSKPQASQRINGDGGGE